MNRYEPAPAARVSRLERRAFLKRCAAAGGALALSACSLPGSGPQAVPPIAQPPTASTATPISLFSWGPSLQTTLQQFEQANPGITVQYTQPSAPDRYAPSHQALLRQLTEGQGAPDVIVVLGDWLGAMAETGGLADLSDAPFDGTTLMPQYPEWVWNSGLQDGKQIALPWQVGVHALVYRNDILEAAGLEATPEALQERLTSWADIIALARAFQQKRPERAFFTDANAVFWAASLVDGAGFVDGKQVLIEERATAAAEYAAQVRALKLDAVSNPKLWNPTVNYRSSLLAGQVAVYLDAGMTALLATDFPQLSGTWRIARLPGQSAWGATYLAIAGQSRHQEAAWKLVHYLSTAPAVHTPSMLSSGLFPAYQPVWESPFFSSPMEYFGGQRSYQLLADIVQSRASLVISPYEQQATTFVTDALKNVLEKGKDPRTAMHDAEQALIAQREGEGLIA